MGDTCVQSITDYYQATMLVIVPESICFCHVVVAMAMIVMGDTCVQSISAIHYYQAINCPRLFVVVGQP